LTSGDGSALETTTGAVAADTSWHEFHFVWAAASVKLYIDGTLIATNSVRVPAKPLAPYLYSVNSSNQLDLADMLIQWG